MQSQRSKKCKVPTSSKFILLPYGRQKFSLIRIHGAQPRLSLVKGERQVRSDRTSAIQSIKVVIPFIYQEADRRLLNMVPPAAPGGTAIPGPRPSMLQAAEARLGREIN